MIRIVKDNTGIFNGQQVLPDEHAKTGVNFLVRSVKNHPGAVRNFLQEKGIDVSGISNRKQLLKTLMDSLFESGNQKFVEDFVERIVNSRYSNIVDPIVTPIILGVTALIGWGKSATDKKAAQAQAESQLNSELLAAQKEKIKRNVTIGLSIFLGAALIAGIIYYQHPQTKKI